jgi:hypothetical protein
MSECKEISFKCPKCCHSDVNVKYIKQDSKFYDKDVQNYDYLNNFAEYTPSTSMYNAYIFHAECFLIHCRTCHYEWVQSLENNQQTTLDANPARPENTSAMVINDIKNKRIDQIRELNLEQNLHKLSNTTLRHIIEDLT